MNICGFIVYKILLKYFTNYSYVSDIFIILYTFYGVYNSSYYLLSILLIYDFICDNNSEL